jgi:hypothetical protein
MVKMTRLPNGHGKYLRLVAAGFAEALPALFTLFLIHRRVRQLRRMVFHLRGPEVPIAVLDAVREAEQHFYRNLGLLRRFAEDLQDVLCFISPGLIYALNVSVGPYRIKAQSVAGLIDYAIERDYLIMAVPPRRKDAALLAYFSMQPFINQWQAALILQHLKEQHPLLATMSWSSIAADRRLIAKLYSGYMGAGGDWATWKASIEPGKVAVERLQLG